MEREIELLLEFRTRLIADVVTGMLDVRCVEVPSDEMAEGDGPPMDPEEVETHEDELIEETADAD